MDEELKFKFNFLLESYKNTENTIRFADTKAGAVVAINVIMLTIIKDHLSTISKVLFRPCHNISEYFHIAVILAAIFLIIPYLITLFLSFVKVFNTVQPRWGKIEKNYNTNDIFWAHDVNNKRISLGMDEVNRQFEAVDAGSLIGDMLYEQAKVADIATKKMENVEYAIKSTKWSFLFWALILVFGLVINSF